MIKIIGAVFVMAGCTVVGIYLAASYRHQERELKRLIKALEYMECELPYRLTRLPELCYAAGEYAGGVIGHSLSSVAERLRKKIAADPFDCVREVIVESDQIPSQVASVLLNLGKSMGRFDLAGQMKGISAAKQECQMYLQQLLEEKAGNLKSYQTLALCAGAAITIILI